MWRVSKVETQRNWRAQKVIFYAEYDISMLIQNQLASLLAVLKLLFVDS